jgi:hypothetical protein
MSKRETSKDEGDGEEEEGAALMAMIGFYKVIKIQMLCVSNIL